MLPCCVYSGKAKSSAGAGSGVLSKVKANEKKALLNTRLRTQDLNKITTSNNSIPDAVEKCF